MLLDTALTDDFLAWLNEYQLQLPFGWKWDIDIDNHTQCFHIKSFHLFCKFSQHFHVFVQAASFFQVFQDFASFFLNSPFFNKLFNIGMWHCWMQLVGMVTSRAVDDIRVRDFKFSRIIEIKHVCHLLLWKLIVFPSTLFPVPTSVTVIISSLLSCFSQLLRPKLSKLLQ